MTAISTGTAITMEGGKLVVPDHPIIPFIEGDGTGPDIWRAAQRVFDAAVAKAYGGRRQIAWLEVLAGEKSKNAVDDWLPEETLTAIRTPPRRDQGPAHDAGGRRHPVAQRGPPPAARPLRLRAPGAVVQGRAVAGAAPRARRHGHLPREHRGHLRRHRVEGRAPRRRSAVISFLKEMGVEDHPLPRHQRHRDQAGLGGRLQAAGPLRDRVRAGPGPQERDAGAQGQHHEVHRGRLPRLGLRAREAGVRRRRDRRRPLVPAARTASW